MDQKLSKIKSLSHWSAWTRARVLRWEDGSEIKVIESLSHRMVCVKNGLCAIGDMLRNWGYASSGGNEGVREEQNASETFCSRLCIYPSGTLQSL